MVGEVSSARETRLVSSSSPGSLSGTATTPLGRKRATDCGTSVTTGTSARTRSSQSVWKDSLRSVGSKPGATTKTDERVVEAGRELAGKEDERFVREGAQGDRMLAGQRMCGGEQRNHRFGANLLVGELPRDLGAE